MSCHTIKVVQEVFEEHGKVFKLLTWPHSQDPEDHCFGQIKYTHFSLQPLLRNCAVNM